MTKEELDKCLDLAKHAIGMDDRKTYTTHGEKVFIPYRNYFTTAEPEEPWELMVKAGYAKREDINDYCCYSMTPDGIQWMVKNLNISICLTRHTGR